MLPLRRAALCLGLGLAAGAPPAAGAERGAASQAALRAAAEGRTLYEAQRFEEALERFRQAYDLYPSPDLHVYTAACLLGLGREREAGMALVEFFADPPRGRDELRTLALRLWQDARTVRDRLLAAGAAALPRGVGRRLQRLPAAAREALPPELRALLVPVAVRLSPPEAQLLVDGEPLAPERGVLHLLRGRHRLRVLPPPGSEFLSREVDVDARSGAEPVAVSLPLGLLLRAPRGTRLYVDGAPVRPDRVEGLVEVAALPAAPGKHQVAAVSPRGRRRELTVEVAPGRSREVVLRPPLLWPGAALAGAGLAAAVTGVALLAIHDRCAPPGGDIDTCPSVYSTDRGGGVALGLGLAALAGGAAWFALSASEHPLFRRPARVAVAPVVGGDRGGLLVRGAF